MAGTDSSKVYFFKTCIILNEAQLPENIGMVMAMLNFGFKTLDWSNQK